MLERVQIKPTLCVKTNAGDINVSDISSDDSFGWRPVTREVDVSLVACEMKMSSSDSSEIPTNSNRSISVNTNLSKTDHNLSPSESSNYDSDDVNKTRKGPSLQTTAELRTRQLENVNTMNKHLKVEPHETSSDEDLGEKNHANISTAVKILNSSNRSMLSHPNRDKNKPKPKGLREPVLLSKVSELNVEQFELDYKAPMLWCEELTDDNDVWLVQCPNTIEPESLVNQRFSLSGVTELSVNPGQQLQVSSFHRHSEPLTCVLPSNKNLSFTTVVVEPAGLLLVKEQVQIPPTIIPPGQKGPVPFPKQLKIRHPLFGSEESRKLIGLELRLTIEYTDELQHAASLHNSVKGTLRIKEEHIVKDNHSMTERRGKKRKRDSKNEILDYLNQDAVNSEPSTVLHSDNNASILDFNSESKKHKKRRLLSSAPDDGFNSTLSEDKPSRHLVKEESNTSLESTDQPHHEGYNRYRAWDIPWWEEVSPKTDLVIVSGSSSEEPVMVAVLCIAANANEEEEVASKIL
uniref:Uncharacterized protein n=1 Tax=Timema genevievae TaxID=629358 RepID=A0A7R9JZ17_TIMGE|nr:unnamed protein product [Timema genevievae]